MKKIVVLFFIILLIIGQKNIIFNSYAQEEVLNQEMQQRLQEIFNNRINLWNTYITEKPPLEEIEIQLKDYITEPLLSTDLEIFYDITVNPTSYEAIEEVHIQDCKVIKLHGNHSSFLVEILWGIQENQVLIYEEIEYVVEMKREDQKWLLSDYRLKP